MYIKFIMQEYANSHLISRCIEKDPLSWAEFVRRFSPLIAFSIQKALRRFTGTYRTGEVEDIKQDIFVMLWDKNKLREVKDRERIDYWLSSVSMNAATSYLRSKNKEILAGDLFKFEDTPDQRLTHPLDGMQKYEKIKELFSTLNTREKLIFKLCFEKNKKDMEVSQILKIPRNSVTSTISKIRKKLKKLS